MRNDVALATGSGRKEPTFARIRRWRSLLAAGCLVFAGISAADAGYIHAKAVLAQLLLERAWSQTLREGGEHRPWPWADTRPVARLSVPRLRRRQIVLAGDSGRVLAFGPGWAEASSAPGVAMAGARTVISGHRDTHFAWLEQVAIGDELALETLGGTQRYTVSQLRVVDSTRERIAGGDDAALLLVTCWPFDAVVAGGPLRYLVTAERVP